MILIQFRNVALVVSTMSEYWFDPGLKKYFVNPRVSGYLTKNQHDINEKDIKIILYKRFA